MDKLAQKQSWIRKQNLELLIQQAGSAKNLAERCDTSSAYISQLRQTLPFEERPIRRIGRRIAAKFEQGMGKPAGWLDIPHTIDNEGVRAGDDTNMVTGPEIMVLHPVVTWVQVSSWITIDNSQAIPESDVYLPCPVACSRHSFVLRVRGDSMEPKFHEGNLIFVDPLVEAESGKFVVVQQQNAVEATFKQLVIEGGQKYLKALNPDWPERYMQVQPDAKICGVVVFKGEKI